jgi:Rrf2 family iron-sulfur cluster assembly transcriptional regulator
MVTQTSELAIKAMVFLALHGKREPVSPADIASRMECSPTYLSKTMSQLVKGGLLKSHRGPQGGMTLARRPTEITLLEIVEATQGVITAPYCESAGGEGPSVCAYHQAMWRVRKVVRDELEKWTLEDLAAEPFQSGELSANRQCRMSNLRGLE